MEDKDRMIKMSENAKRRGYYTEHDIELGLPDYDELKTSNQEVINGNVNPYDLLDLWKENSLSREDIESLGFEDRDMFYYDSKISYKNGVPFVENYMNKSKSKVLSKFIKSHMGGNYGLGSEYIFIEKVKSYENATHISRIIYNGDGSAMVTSAFRGTIKNKSELKRILKQIGI